uniref:F-box domain-containing protein n=1 Tax=Leersia perrieri TaxID=77586 RepID=A0A0D9VFS7_9ORYZ
MEAAGAADSVLHGDLLEHVLLCVPHDELAASTALVSREWRRAARAAHQRNRLRQRQLPCYLVAHVQGAAVGRSTHVYDPLARAWASDGCRRADARALPFRRCACGGAGGDRVYALSLTSMAVSDDALGDGASAWRELPPPRVWRVDPVVAAVGPRFVVLGGGCGATVAAGVVEVLDDEAGGVQEWKTCAPMPAPLAASRRVSAAASWRRVYVVERRTGWASWFDPAARQWGPVRRLQLPGVNIDVESWAACGAMASGFGDDANDRLLVLAGSSSDGVVLLWSVDGDTLMVDANANASMPREMSERLSLGGDIGVAAAGAASGYVYNASEPSKGAVRYELIADVAGVGDRHDVDRTKYGYDEKTCGGRSRWEWEWLPCPPAAAAAMSPSSSSAAVIVFACSGSKQK